MQQLQRKQTWFVLLVVFIMSWSGVAVASVKTMHAGMMQHAFQPVQHSSNISPCYSSDLHNAKAHNGQHNLNQTSQTMMPCQQQTQLHYSSVISPSCQDCHQLHCQNLNNYVEQAMPALPQQAVFATIADHHPDYKVQHLAGFWQEILRPPKA